ncbi:MAG: hypothetical protein ABJB01_07415 [Rudaea sp.]
MKIRLITAFWYGLGLAASAAHAVEGRHSGVVRLFAGPATFQTCALTADARISCWGGNYPSVPDPQNVDGLDVTAVSLGRNFSCALVRDGRVFCWGDNSKGQLGTMSAHVDPKPVQYFGSDFGSVAQISAGEEYVCVRRQDTTAWCWGDSKYGQVGNFNVGIGAYTSQPIQVIIHDDKASPPNPPLTGIADISAGIRHACALLADHTGACWGNDQDGELGNVKYRPNFDSPQTVYVQNGSGYVSLVMGGGSIVAGGYHTCGLINDDLVDSVGCWGLNDYGELGDGTLTEVASAHPAQDERGKIKDAFQVALGEYFTCGVVADATVRCWGSNAHYQMANPTVGLGAAQKTGITALAENGTPLNHVIQLVAGARHACVLQSTGAVRCWGDNQYQQLGSFTGTQTNVPQSISIDAPIFTDNFDGN